MMRTLLLLLILVVPVKAQEPRYFAEIDRNGVVLRVIVADEAFVAKLGGEWVETFMSGEKRRRYAGPGYTFDRKRNAFIPPKPYSSWTINEATLDWRAPAPFPTDGKDYFWDEPTRSWRSK